ncbi:hypothetical protein BRE01_67540 [Brevibacillus reuszeri]|uniref:Single-stranded DNA-binding protein n=1 Tax=Brevibacillus reuszeri TaxID=54915 RepID=A0A0K9YNH0_9BACL|nr:hypothetical protein [Brevibacillus reuszeri]KNB70202.1 hypothetical protein ADS79_14630 [Brevibacillus reuszeri]GED73052.1 hypothetical protein BRE01_67540 [Brevibacillus reuszeri]
MAENKGLGLPQTRGEFKLRGLATGLLRDNAFKVIETKSKKGMHILNFGVETAPESTLYVTIQGVEREEVIYGKKAEEKGKKGEMIKVPWKKRFDQQPEGFNLYGLRIGVEKDQEGKNVTKTLVEYDAAETVYDKLTDGQGVFIRGELEFSSNKVNDEVKRNKKFNVKQLYLADSVDFETEDFKELNDFRQRIIFMGITKVDDKNDPRFELAAKIVTFKTVEDTEFIVRDAAFANILRKELKPYTAIDVWGNIYNKIDTDEIQEAAKFVWGQQDTFKQVKNNYIRELVVTGADPESIDKETYSEEIIEEALKVFKEFGSDNSNNNASWGQKPDDKESQDSEDDGLPW